MTINYKGMDEDFNYRLAEINFDEEKEFTLMKRLAFWLETVKGWNVSIVTDGYAQVVVDDMNEYRYFVQDYKVGKKMICNCMKFGF